MPKAYSYIRFSHPDQKAGDSYRRQQKLAKEYAQANGLELADSKEYAFFDSGKSAYKARHLDVEGELRRFLDLVEAGDIPKGSVLLVESLDRLSRERVSVALPRFLDLLNKGVDVVTLSDGKRYTGGSTDYTDLIVSIVYMAKAHAESDDKSKRVAAAWSQKKKLARDENRPLGRACPAWLVLSEDEQRYEEIPERVGVIRRVFDLYLEGKGAHSICCQLNEEGIAPFGSVRRNPGGKWSVSSVRKLINNRALLGEYQPTGLVDGVRAPLGAVVEGYYPAVLDAETFARAHLAASQRRTFRQTNQPRSGFNLWQGIARCYECDGAMHLVRKGKAPKGADYLHCYASRNKAGCNAKAVRLDCMESVLPEILVKVDSLALVQSSHGRLAKELEVVEGERLIVSGQYRAVNEVFSESPSKAAGLRLRDLEEKLDELDARKKEVEASLAAERVVDKSDFFRKLDLESSDVRNQVNTLFKRLSLRVFVSVRGSRDFICWMSKGSKSPKPFTDYFNDLLFYVMYDKGQVYVDLVSDDLVDLGVLQGELSEVDAVLAKSDSWDDPTFSEEVKKEILRRASLGPSPQECYASKLWLRLEAGISVANWKYPRRKPLDPFMIGLISY